MEESIQKIRIYGDPVLKKVAEEIAEFDASVAELEERLIDSMFNHDNGVGLAAPQIGVSKRMLVIDRSLGEEYGDILTMVNPELIESDGESTHEEGCLSVPGIYEPVTRPSRVYVKYRDVDGNEREIENDEFLGRVIQHEMDHLNGILFVDRLSTIRRTLLTKKLKSLASEQEDGDV